jgi:hemerythrin-like domain-containing protein
VDRDRPASLVDGVAGGRVGFERSPLRVKKGGSTMRRHRALVALSRDHHDVLQLAEGLRRGGPSSLRDVLPAELADLARHVQRFAVDRLEPHFVAEEQTLFPASRGRDRELDKLIETLHMEHARITALVKELDCGREIETTLDTLGRTLIRHVRSEERDLFEMIQKHLTEAELDALVPGLDRAVAEP